MSLLAQLIIFTLEPSPTLEETLFPNEPAGKFRFVTLDSAFHKFYPAKRIAAPTMSNLFRILSTLAKERPDVCHCTSDAIALQFGLAGKLTGVPVVTSMHTDVQLALGHAGAPQLAMMATGLKDMMESRLLDGCATTSPSFLAKLEGMNIHCDHVVKTAVLVDTFTPESRCHKTRSQLTFGHPGGFLVVFVGRLSPEKGIDKLLKMTKALDGCYLALIGDGPMADHLASLHGARNRVYCVPGFLSHKELPTIYASADVHATCSEFETLGNTVLEAHSCGIPVVAPRTQGFVDTITNGSDGFLYDPKKGGGLGEGIRRLEILRDDADLRVKMGAAGRAKVLKQSPELVAADIVGWYGERMQKYRSAWLPQAVLAIFPLMLAVLSVSLVWYSANLVYHMLELGAAGVDSVANAIKHMRSIASTSPLFKSIKSSYSSLSMTPVVDVRRKGKQET